MIFAFIEHHWGAEQADEIAIWEEYVRNRDPTVDPFAKYAG